LPYMERLKPFWYQIAYFLKYPYFAKCILCETQKPCFAPWMLENSFLQVYCNRTPYTF
jgi:hypothetical protein